MQLMLLIPPSGGGGVLLASYLQWKPHWRILGENGCSVDIIVLLWGVVVSMDLTTFPSSLLLVSSQALNCGGTEKDAFAPSFMMSRGCVAPMDTTIQDSNLVYMRHVCTNSRIQTNKVWKYDSYCRASNHSLWIGWIWMAGNTECLLLINLWSSIGDNCLDGQLFPQPSFLEKKHTDGNTGIWKEGTFLHSIWAAASRQYEVC